MNKDQLVKVGPDTPCQLCSDLGADKWVNRDQNGTMIFCMACLIGMTLYLGDQMKPAEREMFLSRFRKLNEMAAAFDAKVGHDL